MKPLQDEAEISAFAQFAVEAEVHSYLEIGSKFGGSLWRVGSVLPKGSKIVSVDLPNGTRVWHESRKALEDCCLKLADLGHDVRTFWGDSTDPKIIQNVVACAPYDLVFIDANHTTPYLEKDWANYGPLGKMIAFHDISWSRDPAWVGSRINVPEFWNDLKQRHRHIEIKLDESKKNNGIGVLWI